MKKTSLMTIIASLLLLSACNKTAIPKEEINKIPAMTNETEASTQTYTNQELKYSFEYPMDWTVDDSGLTNIASKDVIAFPGNSRPFEPDPNYFNVHVDDRELNYLFDEVFSGYTRVDRADIPFVGQTTYQFSADDGNQLWWVIPYNGQNYVIWTDKSTDEGVRVIMESFKFM